MEEGKNDAENKLENDHHQQEATNLADHFGNLALENASDGLVSPVGTSKSTANEKGAEKPMMMPNSGINRISVNVGILGHVDCGKTTLARKISSLASTAAFDKHSKAENLRANTIDLGFSSLIVDQYTVALIDCPGHASLIGAVLCASSVFDAAIIVVDAQKGVQTQTAEHLLLVSILCPQHAMIVINKIDLVDNEQVKNLKKQLVKVLKYFSICPKTPIVCVSLTNGTGSITADIIIETLREILYEPKRSKSCNSSSSSFIMSVDHCFPIKGKGTVMTGTITDGCCSIGMEVEIGTLKIRRKIKGIQKWKTKVESATMGERVGILFQDLPPKHIDRTIIFQRGALESVQYMLADLKRISQFKAKLLDGTKIHFSIGFETVMATCHFLSASSSSSNSGDECVEYEQLHELNDNANAVLLLLDRPIYARIENFYMATKLDMQHKGCRFAFYGHVKRILENSNQVNRFHRKHRIGHVERIEADQQSLICTGLFTKHSDISVFQGMQIQLSTGDSGRIENAFGKSGKTRIQFSSTISQATLDAYKSDTPIEVHLRMKKYLNENRLVSYIP